ncbi:hypothetical protein MKW98_000357 [Papaver atlanticum]|uniref:Uncharacterized protein n=1 Tax=Papaver atlanticum TaxID=357466 RepID=A0AAD4S3I2_9MAGN|nr:hypothetical protein MKW98_000357 [Papaver atlanticum]
MEMTLEMKLAMDWLLFLLDLEVDLTLSKDYLKGAIVHDLTRASNLKEFDRGLISYMWLSFVFSGINIKQSSKAKDTARRKKGKTELGLSDQRKRSSY